jgi:hypothetical protein
MKKLFVITLFLLSFIGNAQEETTTSSMLICSNEDRTKWFMIMPHLQEFNGLSKKDYLSTIKLNIGKCSKRDVLTFKFSDGKYMNLRANNDFDCSVSELNFSLNPIQIAVLRMKSIKSIRYTNGSDRSYFLYRLTGDDRNHFINLLKK